MKETTRIVFEADDGKVFDTRQECERHEAEQARLAKITTYWHVTFAPDLTEGRGWYGSLLIKVVGPEEYNAEILLADWCYRKIGRPVAFVQGVSLMRNWQIRPTSVGDYDRQNRHAQVGDYIYPAHRIELTLGAREEGLVGELPARS